jgi:phosphoribosylamine---glycine ligase
MGAYAPTSLIDSKTMSLIYEQILEPTIQGLASEGRTYKGVLYVGLMLTNRSLKVLEYNCRFGDPETQVVLPLLESDLVEIFDNIAEGYLNVDEIKWADKYTGCVVMASGGYPENYQIGKAIKGLDQIGNAGDCVVFHAGTKKVGNDFVTSGGRVVGVTGIGNSIRDALKTAYRYADKISFENAYYRKDIGWRATNRIGDFG